MLWYRAAGYGYRLGVRAVFEYTARGGSSSMALYTPTDLIRIQTDGIATPMCTMPTRYLSVVYQSQETASCRFRYPVMSQTDRGQTVGAYSMCKLASRGAISQYSNNESRREYHLDPTGEMAGGESLLI